MRRSVNNGFPKWFASSSHFFGMKSFITLVYRRGRSGRNGRLRPGKETGGAGQGGAGRLRFDQVGRLRCIPASRAHRKSCSISTVQINCLAGSAEE